MLSRRRPQQSSFDSLGSETARSQRSLSESRREKLTAILERQNNKPRAHSRLISRNSRKQYEVEPDSARARRRQGELSMKHRKAAGGGGYRRGGGKGSSSKGQRRGGEFGASRGGGVMRMKIPENEPMTPINPSVQILVPDPVFFNGLNAIERPQWSLMENASENLFGLSFWIRPSPTLGAKMTTRAEKYNKRKLIGGKAGMSSPGTARSNEKGVDMSGAEWRVVCCRRGSRAIDSILRMQQYGEGPKYENPRLDVEPGELCTPTVQLSAKTCQLQMFVWTAASRSRPTGRLITNATCPYGIWTHVTIALSEHSAKIFLNGKLDVSGKFDERLLLPEASLLLGRGHMPRKKDGKGQNSQYAPSVASSSNASRISTASFVNGGDSPASTHSTQLADSGPEGFVGFLSHVTMHSRPISGRDIHHMVREGQGPVDPIEQDEWSMLVNVSKRLQDDQERQKRAERERSKMEQKKVLDDQVAYLKEKRARNRKAEMEADMKHLSQYNASGDQLAKEIAREKRERTAKHRKEMEEQRRLEFIKKDIRDQKEMELEREDMRLLQDQIRKSRHAEKSERAHKRETNKRMMSDYKVLMEEKAQKEAALRELSRHDREVAEDNARTTRQLETARKRKKQTDQHTYRRELAEQVQRKKAQGALKYHLSEQERTINRQFLQQIIDGQDGGNASNWEGSQYSFGPQTGRGGDTYRQRGDNSMGTMSKSKLAELKNMLR